MSHRDIDTAFVVFHTLNPDFLQEILRIARHAKARGKTRISMRLIFEVFRFKRTLAIVGAGEYTVNNSFTPFYSRLVKQQDPELGQLFEIREARTKLGANMIQEASYEDDLFSMV